MSDLTHTKAVNIAWRAKSWLLERVHHTVLALDFLLACLLSLSFRHLVCLLLSRDRAWILTQLLCLGFNGCKDLRSRRAVDWRQLLALLFFCFFLLLSFFQLSETKATQLFLFMCMCFFYFEVCDPLELCKTYPLNMTLSHCSSAMKHNETQLNHSVHDCEIYDSEGKKSPLQDRGFHSLIWWLSSWTSGLRHILLYNRDTVDSNPLLQVISSLSVLST